MRIPAFLALLIATPLLAAPEATVTRIVPSTADPAIKQFDEPSVAIADPTLPADAALAVFLPGTGGKPENAVTLLDAIAGQGYRVIGLEYDDEPAVVGVCPRDPDPDCSAKFRAMRIDGSGPGVSGVTNPVAESIAARLVATLRALDKLQPTVGWGRYLDGDQPRWDRITVSGLSQGAGMAAFIAKQHAVRRVVLFSSPWDFTGADRRPAPWISLPGKTPIDRWQAAYNRRENTVPLIRAAYAALGLPSEQVHVFDLDLPAGMQPRGPNPYHPIGIRDVRYTPQWQAMYGKGS
jgi:hypothetical protein